MGRPITSPVALNIDMCNLQHDLMHILELGKACVEWINMCVYVCVLWFCDACFTTKIRWSCVCIYSTQSEEERDHFRTR